MNIDLGLFFSQNVMDTMDRRISLDDGVLHGIKLGAVADSLKLWPFHHHMCPYMMDGNANMIGCRW